MKYQRYFKESLKNALKEQMINNNQQSSINDKFTELAQDLTNYNNVPISQIKRILNGYSLVLIDSEGKEVPDESVTLNDQENSVNYGLAFRSDTKEGIGEGDTIYEPTENGRVSVRRNKDDEGNLSVLVSLLAN